MVRKFNVRDRAFLDEAINSFLRESKQFEENSKLLGKRPIVTYEYWKMMAEDVLHKIEFHSTQKANRQSRVYNEEMNNNE